MSNFINDFYLTISNDNLELLNSQDLSNEDIPENYSNITMINVGNGQCYFKAKPVAEFLGFKNTKGAITRHVDEDDKIAFRDLEHKFEGGVGERYPQLIHPRTIFITEDGVYDLILKSKLKICKQFKLKICKQFTKFIYSKIRGIVDTNTNNEKKSAQLDYGKVYEQYAKNTDLTIDIFERLGTLDDRSKLDLSDNLRNMKQYCDDRIRGLSDQAIELNTQKRN